MGVVCADDKVFLVSIYERQERKSGIIECYDPDKDEWKEKTQIPLEWMPSSRGLRVCLSTRVLKGSKLFQTKFLQHEEDCSALP